MTRSGTRCQDLLIKHSDGGLKRVKTRPPQTLNYRVRLIQPSIGSAVVGNVIADKPAQITDEIFQFLVNIAKLKLDLVEGLHEFFGGITGGRSALCHQDGQGAGLKKACAKTNRNSLLINRLHLEQSHLFERIHISPFTRGLHQKETSRHF